MNGHFDNKLDNKGRAIIPSKLRKGISDFIYISPGLDKVLTIRTEDDYSVWSKAFMALPSNKKDVRNIQRAILGNTFKLSVDKLGRINFPEQLLDYASIEEEIVFVGLGKRIEVFSKTAWTKFMKDTGTGILEDAAENLEGFDI